MFKNDTFPTVIGIDVSLRCLNCFAFDLHLIAYIRSFVLILVLKYSQLLCCNYSVFVM